MIPSFFMVLVGVMAALGMGALWQSLRAVFAGGLGAGGDSGDGLPERAALDAEKRTLLRAIKDIQFEKEMGKISDEDFARLDKAYRRRAKEVLAVLDENIEPYVVRAEREVAKAMGEDPDRGPYRAGRIRRRKRAQKRRREARTATRGIECPACGTHNDEDALHCKACATRIAPVTCPKCGTENDPDAKFCKACAAPMTGSSEDE